MTTVQIIPFGKKAEPSNLLLKEYNLRNRKDFFKKDRLIQLDFPKKHRGTYPTMSLRLRGKRTFGIFEKSISAKDLRQQINLLLHEIKETSRKGIIDINDLYCLINNRMGWQLR